MKNIHFDEIEIIFMLNEIWSIIAIQMLSKP